MQLRTIGAGLLVVGAIAISAACGGSEAGPSTAPAPGSVEATPAAPASASRADLSGIKAYLREHTGLLRGFTAAFLADAQRYYDLAAGVGFDYVRLQAEHGPEAADRLAALKAAWVEGNPYYEEMEGVVAGTPSLAEYDVILDAGSSAEEDPTSAVPFDLTTPSGTVLEQPGNLYSLTEGMLWGTLTQYVARADVDLDDDGTVAFGEVLPDADALLAAAQAFDRYAGELATAAEAWQPTESDAFTALVVMVPTMSEYFGQWSDSRFVEGDGATSEAFNVVSRLSDIRDIVGSLDVVYAGVEPLVASVDAAQAEQTGAALDELAAFIGDLHEQEQAGRTFTAEEASTLGAEAQERGTAIAGQVSQVAARLGIEIAQ